MKLGKGRGVASGTAVLLALLGCAHRDAAMLGAVIGHGVGTPLGVAAVAVDETFATAGEIRAANPRYASPPQALRVSPGVVPKGTPVRRSRSQDRVRDGVEVSPVPRRPNRRYAVARRSEADEARFWQASGPGPTRSELAFSSGTTGR